MMGYSLPTIFAALLSACMLWVVVSDARHYIISNRLNAVIALLFVAAVMLIPIPGWLSALAAAGVMLLVGLGLFSLGLMGGGDIKLLVVLSLWTGWHVATLQFLFMTAIAGGVLVVIVLIARAVLPPLWLKANPPKNLPRLLTRKQPIPYGIAIAAGFCWIVWMGLVPALPV